jgi:hypothetical protein
VTMKPSQGLLTSSPPRDDRKPSSGPVFTVVIVAVVLTGLFTGIRLAGGADLDETPKNSGMFIDTLSFLTALTFSARLVWMIIAKCRGTLYPAAWTSAALAPERSVVLGGLILIVFGFVSSAKFGSNNPDLPASLAPLVLGALLGLPLVEVFVSRANEWRLLVTDRDPD